MFPLWWTHFLITSYFSKYFAAPSLEYTTIFGREGPQEAGSVYWDNKQGNNKHNGWENRLIYGQTMKNFK